MKSDNKQEHRISGATLGCESLSEFYIFVEVTVTLTYNLVTQNGCGV